MADSRFASRKLKSRNVWFIRVLVLFFLVNSIVSITPGGRESITVPEIIGYVILAGIVYIALIKLLDRYGGPPTASGRKEPDPDPLPDNASKTLLFDRAIRTWHLWTYRGLLLLHLLVLWSGILVSEIFATPNVDVTIMNGVYGTVAGLIVYVLIILVVGRKGYE